MFGVLLVGGGFGWTMLGAEGATGPTDLWQPEGFTFPSLMTNALFACSLWLIVEVWLAVLDAKDSWKPVARGFLAMLVLGNIHTYDVLGIGVTAVAFAGCLGAARLLTLGWFIRALVICAGAVPPAMWLKHVIDTDAVFAARAATLTFSPGIWQFLMGYAPLLVLAVVLVILTTEGSGLSTPQSEPRSSRTRRRASLQLGIWLIPLPYAALAIFGGLNQSPTMQTVAGFCAGFIALCLGAMALTSGIKVDRNHRAAMILLLAWATVSLWLPYFPGLFQRKLTMGSQIPLSLLAGLGLGMLLQRGREHGKESRPLTVLALAVLSISNWLWLTRSLDHITTNVASTGIHPVFLDREQKQALDWLRDNAPEDAAVLDLTFYACFIPAFAGQRTIGSHWSETPDFGPKFNLINRGIYGLGGPALRLNARLNLARETGANYAIWHKSPETDTNPLTDFSSLGPILFDRPELAIVANSETFPHGS